MNNDAEHLRLLSIFHYVYAAMMASVSVVGVIYVVLGSAFAIVPLVATEATPPAVLAPPAVEAPRIVEAPGFDMAPAEFPALPDPFATTGEASVEAPGSNSSAQSTPPAAVFVALGSLFALLGLGFVFFGLLYAGATFLAGRCIARQTHHTLCLVVAALHCLNAPLGTVLGVFTFVVLLRPTVQQAFRTHAKPVPV